MVQIHSLPSHKTENPDAAQFSDGSSLYANMHIQCTIYYTNADIRKHHYYHFAKFIWYIWFAQVLLIDSFSYLHRNWRWITAKISFCCPIGWTHLACMQSMSMSFATLCNHILGNEWRRQSFIGWLSTPKRNSINNCICWFSARRWANTRFQEIYFHLHRNRSVDRLTRCVDKKIDVSKRGSEKHEIKTDPLTSIITHNNRRPFPLNGSTPQSYRTRTNASNGNNDHVVHLSNATTIFCSFRIQNKHH